YRTVRAELKAYGAGLERKKEIVALSKSDCLSAEALAHKADELKRAARKKPLVVSAVARQGLQALIGALAREIAKARRPPAEAQEARSWQPGMGLRSVPAPSGGTLMPRRQLQPAATTASRGETTRHRA